MLEHEVPAPPDDGILIDRCTAPGACGVWYDAGEYHALHARLHDLRVRAALVSAVRMAPTVGRPELPCPRCAQGGLAQTLAGVRFVGVDLGLCERCLGVWAPREALRVVYSAMALHDPTNDARRPAHYRAAATGPEMQPNAVLRTRCAGCQQDVAVADVSLSERGCLCGACAFEALRGQTEASLAGRDAGGTLWSYLRQVFGLFGRGAARTPSAPTS